MLTDLLAALAVVVNSIPQGLLALSFGFAAFPTALAFVIGIAGSLAYQSVATLSFQAETITLADIGSSLFGGGPVEAIISGTATAPNPIRSSVMMMAVMALLLLLKLLPVIGRYVHRASTGGSLLSLEKLLGKVGCQVLYRAAVLLEEGGFDGDLIYLDRLPLFRD